MASRADRRSKNQGIPLPGGRLFLDSPSLNLVLVDPLAIVTMGSIRTSTGSLREI